jgi:hypothetical protein
VEHLSASTAVRSSPKFTVISRVCTTPLFRSETFLRQKYEHERLSARQISFLIGCSHSIINKALTDFKIKKRAQQSGWIEYGWQLKLGKRTKFHREQVVIRLMQKWRKEGSTLNNIAQRLNDLNISSPKGSGKWHSTTIGRILKRI